MLISGLWKLAAMAGVIGVGLVAVYQAHKGLDPSLAMTAMAEQPGDSSDASAPGDSSATTPPAASPTPLDADTLSLENPFEVQTTQATPAKPRELPSADDSQPFASNDAPPTQNSDPFATNDSAAESSAPKKSSSGAGLDFREDLTNSGPELGSTIKAADETSDFGPAVVSEPKTDTVEPTGFNDAAPARLPDEVDPFAETTVPTDAKPAQEPFVRQSKDKTTAPASKAASSELDPFADSAPPELSPKPDDLEPNRPAAKDVTAPESDPLAESPARTSPSSKKPTSTVPSRAPVESGFDPFGNAETVKPRTNSTSLSLGSPTSEKRRDPANSADPFAEQAAPPALTPVETRPESSPRDVELTPSNSVAPRSRTSLPRLPTEVPDPSEDGGHPLRHREPPLNRRSSEQPSRATPNDLVGDGIITDNAPRGVQQPRLTIEKIAPQQAVLGEPLIYSVIVKNVGGSEAHHVVVEDRIPKGTELTGTSPRAEMVDKKLFWRIGTMKPNEEKKISIRVIPKQEGPIGSVARVNFAAEVAAEILIAAPQLSFTVNAPRQAKIGESLELTFLLKNTGNAAANNVSVRDIVPEGLKHEAASDIECPIGKLAPNESREIVLQVTAVKPGRVKNRAVLSGDGGIAQELESTIEIIGEQLVVTRTGQNRIYAERPAVFTNSVKNEGNAQVNRVKVSEIVPAGMEFVEASDGGHFDPVERAIHWTVGPLPPGGEAAVSAKLIAKSPGIQQTKITAAGPAGSAATVKSEVDVVGRPELQMETLSATGIVAVGDRITSKIQLKNNGSAPARNVVLSVRMPVELKLVEVRGGRYQVKNNTVQLETIPELGPREAASVELVMEAIAEADAQMDLQISADHLTKPARRIETVQIATEVR